VFACYPPIRHTYTAVAGRRSVWPPPRSAPLSTASDHQPRLTLGLRLPALLRLIIRSTQNTRFGPSITPQTFELLGRNETLESGRREYENGTAFFEHFDDQLAPEDLAGLKVLDLGCGYGGRTIYYAKDCHARQVTGVEINPEMVSRCQQLADQFACLNADFALAYAEDLPFPDGLFDAVVSYDVLEHVTDPFRSMTEIARVLAPGGRAWLVFPTYLGARSSHLDYLTLVPALHRIFRPEVLISVANEFLSAHPEHYGTQVQPAPSISSLGRLTLPTLNGLTLPDARSAVARSGLRLTHVAYTPIVTPHLPVPGAGAVAQALRLWAARFTLPEFLIANIAFTAVKP
jgi:ubiquinone/menaquinone biosynthesis C-methylase UbiE